MATADKPDLPDLAALDLADSVRHHEPYVMRAVYHDTDSLALFRWGVTLRRREGGSDEGWHMKLPVAGADGSARDELRLELPRELPEEAHVRRDEPGRARRADPFGRP